MHGLTYVKCRELCVALTRHCINISHYCHWLLSRHSLTARPSTGDFLNITSCYSDGICVDFGNGANCSGENFKFTDSNDLSKITELVCDKKESISLISSCF